MTNCNASGGSWAIEMDTFENGDTAESGSRGSTESHSDALSNTDLRHQLRRSMDENEVDGHSPIKSPTRPRRHRNVQDAAHSKYTREKDGLSPLRSPLNSDQRSSRVNTNSRRRSLRNEHTSKKENELPKDSSPHKKNRYTHHVAPADLLSVDSEEQKFRRRLDLPAEEASDTEDQAGLLDPENEEDRITIERREKQIAYGKSTESYKLYIKTVPKDERIVDRKKHPRTPVKNIRLSRRNFDAQIKAWKKHVHNWANRNFPTIVTAPPRPSGAGVGSGPSSARQKAEDLVKEEVEEEEEEDNSIDLNEEDDDDESFLEGFEINYEIGDASAES